MFPPDRLLKARNSVAPCGCLLVANGTNTEKLIETLLPVSRGYAVILLQCKNAAQCAAFVPRCFF
jgi:hypothetical protein